MAGTYLIHCKHYVYLCFVVHAHVCGIFDILYSMHSDHDTNLCLSIPSITHAYKAPINSSAPLSIHCHPFVICPASQSIHPSVLIHSLQCPSLSPSICCPCDWLFFSIYPSVHSFIFILSVYPFVYYSV